VLADGLWRTVQRAIDSPGKTARLIAILVTLGGCAAMCGWAWRRG
jgi:hypothetical protein